MKDKFCISKSLAYLVALVVVVVGAYFMMNYANTQKVTTNSEAATKALLKDPKCNVSYDPSKGEEPWCIITAVAKGPSVAISFLVKQQTGKEYSAVRKTGINCGELVKIGSVQTYWGSCVVLTRKNTGTGTGTGTSGITPAVISQAPSGPGGANPTFSQTKCSTYGYAELPTTAKSRLRDYCKNRNGVKYGSGTDVVNGVSSRGCFSLNTKTCATAVNCESEYCLRCINERVNDPNKTLCPPEVAKCAPNDLPTMTTGIKAVVSGISTAINSTNDAYRNGRIDAARRKLLNYYALRTTTGYDASNSQNKGGCVLSVSKYNSAQCNDKTVSQDYCSCATWSVTSDVVNEDCKNVIGWVNSGKYDQAP